MSGYFSSSSPTPNALSPSEKAPLNPELKKEGRSSATEAVKGDTHVQEKATIADTQEEADALRIPPDPNVPSGILSVIIHQINNRK